MYGWEPMVSHNIKAARAWEMKKLVTKQYLSGISNFFGYTAPILATGVAFAAYSHLTGKALTPAVAFASLAWFNILNRPVRSFPRTALQAATNLSSFAYVLVLVVRSVAIDGCLTLRLPCECCSRLSKFFLAPEAPRRSGPSTHDTSAGGFTTYGALTASRIPTPTAASSSRVEFVNATFRWPTSDPSAAEAAKSAPNVVIDKADAASSSDAGTPAPVLRRISLTLADGELVVVIGRIGAGKSSLLAAFAGGVDLVEGSMRVDGSVACVGQQPWIQNMSLKDNVTFIADRPFDAVRYRDTIKNCGMKQDIRGMIHGDDTLIGDSGITLSGMLGLVCGLRDAGA